MSQASKLRELAVVAALFVAVGVALTGGPDGPEPQAVSRAAAGSGADAGRSGP